MTPDLCAAMGVEGEESPAVAPGGMVVQRKALPAGGGSNQRGGAAIQMAGGSGAQNGAQNAAQPDAQVLAQASVLRTKLGELRAPLANARRHAHMIETLHFKGNTFGQLNGGITQYNAAVAQLPAPINQLASMPSVASSGTQAAIAAVAVPAPVIIGILEALAAAIEVVIGAALAEVLLILAGIALLLYAVYLAIKAIVEAIAEAIEKMRPQPPIFWSASLPLPPALTFVRTKPANPRVPGGQQSRVAAAIRAAGKSATEVAHHVLPLFLGGRDELTAPPNVVPLNKTLHILGHASLVAQPHMAIWGYSGNLYDHPPPGGYFLAGLKVP